MLNPHLHSATLDGCYIQSKPDGPLTFLPIPAPTRPEVASIAWSICKKTVARLKRRGLALGPTPEDLDPLHGSEPFLAECAAASLQGVVLIGPRAGRSVRFATTDCSRRAPSFDRPSSPSRLRVTAKHNSSSPR
ncbi:MAG: hypothetical protein V3T05_05195 [Myxococcota bacterium]